MSDQDERNFYEPYSVRRRKAMQDGTTVPYVYEPIPQQLRVQVVHILDQAIGKHVSSGVTYVGRYSNEITPQDIWQVINVRVAAEAGMLSLGSSPFLKRDRFTAYFLGSDLNADDVLNAVEIAFRLVDKLNFSDGYARTYRVHLTPADANALLNVRFRQHDLGYQYVGGQIIRADSEFIFQETTEPAFSLLKDVNFAGPLDEFMKAHRHFRHGEIEDAIVDANNAFESTMKAICAERKIQLVGNENAQQLIAHMVSGTVPRHMQSSLHALSAVLQSLPTLRNRTAGAGHGQGAQPIVVLDHIGSYALNMAAASIVLLIQSWQALSPAADG